VERRRPRRSGGSARCARRTSRHSAPTPRTGPILCARTDGVARQGGPARRRPRGLLHDTALQRVPGGPGPPRTASARTRCARLLIEAWLLRVPKKVGNGLPGVPGHHRLTSGVAGRRADRMGHERLTRRAPCAEGASRYRAIGGRTTTVPPARRAPPRSFGAQAVSRVVRDMSAVRSRVDRRRVARRGAILGAPVPELMWTARPVTAATGDFIVRSCGAFRFPGYPSGVISGEMPEKGPHCGPRASAAVTADRGELHG